MCGNGCRHRGLLVDVAGELEGLFAQPVLSHAAPVLTKHASHRSTAMHFDTQSRRYSTVLFSGLVDS
jgi:hypothetical protein